MSACVSFRRTLKIFQMVAAFSKKKMREMYYSRVASRHFSSSHTQCCDYDFSLVCVSTFT